MLDDILLETLTTKKGGSEREILAAAQHSEDLESQDDESDRQGQMTSKGRSISRQEWSKWLQNHSNMSMWLTRRQSKASFDPEQHALSGFQ